MRIFAAGFGAAFVNHAVIVGQQKRAGMFAKNKIIILISHHVFFNEISRFHFQMFRKRGNIPICKPRTNGFTAIGTIETTKSFKSLFM